VGRSSDSVLAIEQGIGWDIHRVEGAGRLSGGLVNVVVQGGGKVAVTSDGEPVLLDTSKLTFADPESAIAWSGNVRTGIRSDVSFRTFTGRGSGESFQMSFEGPDWALIQPSEGRGCPAFPRRRGRRWRQDRLAPRWRLALQHLSRSAFQLSVSCRAAGPVSTVRHGARQRRFDERFAERRGRRVALS